MAAMGGTSSCLIALTEGDLYFSQKQSDSEYDKISLADPWAAFDIFMADNTHGAFLKLMPLSESVLLVVTEDNVLSLELDTSTCGKLVSQKTVMTDGVATWSASVGAVAASADKSLLWVASSNKVFQVDLTRGTMVDIDYADGMAANVERGPVHALEYVSQWGKLFVSTETVFYMLAMTDGSQVPIRVNHEWITGVLDSAPVDMAFDSHHGDEGHLWLVQWGALHRLDVWGRFDRFGYHQGAPVVSNLTAVAVTPSAVWIGTTHGALSLDLPALNIPDDTLRVSTLPGLAGEGADAVIDRNKASSSPWKWTSWAGNRYSADDTVTALTVVLSAGAGDASSTVVIQTETGLGMMDLRPWTLAEKSSALGRMQFPRHDHDGLTANVGLESYGDVSTYDKYVTDNDGLWTSMHVMGEAYCFLSTGDVNCRKRAWRGFTGLEALSNVTGAYPWFPARSFCPVDGDVLGCGNADGDDRWHDSPNPMYAGYKFKDDTSSDEIDGHLAALPLVYDVVASDEAERERAYTLIDGYTKGIVDNDLYLIDPTTGKPTTWGFWNPNDLNGNPDHYSERGTNALGILAYLVSAYSITGRQMYMDQYYELTDKYAYLYSVLNVKIDNPDDDNHSDNELISMTYHTAFWALRRFQVPQVAARMTPAERAREPAVKKMVELLLPGARRTWQLISSEFDPFFTGVYAGLGQMETPSVYVDRAQWMLKKQPLDLIDWPSDYTWRADIEITPFHHRDNENDAVVRQIIPLDQRPARRFNSDPFDSQQGSGTTEFEPAVYRLPYYMMLFFGLL